MIVRYFTLIFQVLIISFKTKFNGNLCFKDNLLLQNFDIFQQITCRLSSTLVLAEHTSGKLNPITLNTVNAASRLGEISVLITGTNIGNIAEQVNLILLSNRFFSILRILLIFQLNKYL